jgi:hypothetical protein
VSIRGTLAATMLIASAGCDGFVRARVKVVSTDGEGMPDALIRLEGATDHDLARYTDDEGCAYFSGVVAPVRSVSVDVGKAGFQSKILKLPTIQENCVVVELAREGDGTGAVNLFAVHDCPCDTDAGYSPTVSARFKVSTTGGLPLNSVALERADRPPNPWSQVTDDTGCLGVSWIVSAGLGSIPLVLEKPAYQPARIDVPTMEERCYEVSLARAGARQSSVIVTVSEDKCECEMFTGETVWRE